MAGKKQKSKEKVAAQTMRTKLNKIAAWKKHLIKNPDDVQGKEILDKLMVGA